MVSGEVVVTQDGMARSGQDSSGKDRRICPGTGKLGPAACCVLAATRCSENIVVLVSSSMSPCGYRQRNSGGETRSAHKALDFKTGFTSTRGTRHASTRPQRTEEASACSKVASASVAGTLRTQIGLNRAY